MDVQVPDAAPRTHYLQRTLEEATAKEISGWLAWMGAMSVSAAEGCVRWSDEIIVYRSGRGTIQGAHGLRFLDVVRPPSRVVSTVFSVFDRNTPGGAAQLSDIASRIFPREGARRQPLPLIWAATSADGSEALQSSENLNVTRLKPAAANKLPPDVQLYQDSSVAPGLESALVQLLQSQRDLKRDMRSSRPAWSRAVRLVTGTGTVAAAFLFMFARPDAKVDGVKPTRTKGGAALRVYRQSPTSAEELVSGDVFHAGEKVRFGVDLSASSRVKILGVESTGKLYTAWPQSGGASLVPAGEEQHLEGALSLDDSSGRETLYLITCPPNQTDVNCMHQGAGEPLCPPSCQVSPFVLDKHP